MKTFLSRHDSEPDDFCWTLSCWEINNRPHRYELGIRAPDRLPLWRADKIELNTEDVAKLFGSGKDDGQKKPTATARDESAATKALAAHLRTKSDLTKTAAKNWCSDQGFKVSDRGFKARVWPEARSRAGLPSKVLPGRKRK